MLAKQHSSEVKGNCGPDRCWWTKETHFLEMDNTVVEEENEENDVVEPGKSFTDSEDDVNDDDFLDDHNDPDRIALGLNSDPVVVEQHVDAIGEESDLDHSYDPTAEELNTDYSSDEETPVRYPIFNEDKELWDPQFEVDKTFIYVLKFRKYI
ncbi:Uncharacterized protein Adt_39182 [Abeliophyllum distichum]|uniref:Uncharacterized protein n=1 Tax=Abeliophyllum distichum TaxID=126358 RepID=A0ABD1Q4G4_9LAMI